MKYEYMKDDRMVRTAPDGSKWVLQDKFLRITQNPVAPRYPHTGDTIKLQGHGLIPDGEYIVEMVTEFEPGIDRDEDGRDIRISLIGQGHRYGRDLNGMNIRMAMIRATAKMPDRGGWARQLFKFFK